MAINCPICQNVIPDPLGQVGRGITQYQCPRCGQYQLDVIGKYILTEERDFYGEIERKNLAHVARKNWEFTGEPILFTAEVLRRHDRISVANNPVAQSENLILWLGKNQKSSGAICVVTNQDHFESVIGAADINDVVYVCRELAGRGFLAAWNGSVARFALQLTFAGWERYRDLQAGITESNRVFMAMKFGDASLDALFNDHYKSALEGLGYELFRLDEVPAAGSITNRMRVAIRESKFVVADLSYGNRGAYWEAGFGEGLGKKVIYSVNESTLDTDHHFDVQGQQAVIWTADNMQKAADDLVAIVKATFF